MFTLTYSHHAKKVVALLKELNLCEGTFRRNDGKKIIKEHLKSINLAPQYKHDPNPQDLVFQGYVSYKEVLNYMENDNRRTTLNRVQETE